MLNVSNEEITLSNYFYILKLQENLIMSLWKSKNYLRDALRSNPGTYEFSRKQ